MAVKILVVDNDADVRAALVTTLRHSFALLEESDGDKALALISRKSRGWSF